MAVKRTVVINDEIDKYIRETYRALIDRGMRANYSVALNILLMAAILETQEEGWSQDTRDHIIEYASKFHTIKEIIDNYVDMREFRSDLP
ncbi:MAG: hypothetical protein JXA46_07270 [Dehalococcoidales bacterium]|nr:hypothetical protein [Dehalococcoidales bacterium]